MKDLEPERLDRLEQVEHGVFARPGAFGGACIDLKVRQQVVSECDELLPGAQRLERPCRHIADRSGHQVRDGGCYSS